MSQAEPIASPNLVGPRARSGMSAQQREWHARMAALPTIRRVAADPASRARKPSDDEALSKRIRSGPKKTTRGPSIQLAGSSKSTPPTTAKPKRPAR